MIMENRTGSGIDVFLHATFLILLGWLGLSHYLVRKSLEDALGGLLFIGSPFFIVVLHELGHALTARRQKGRLMLDPPPNPANPPGPPPDAPAPCGLPAPGTGTAKVLEGRVGSRLLMYSLSCLAISTPRGCARSGISFPMLHRITLG